MGLLVGAVACGGGSDDDAEHFCDAAEAFLEEGHVPTTTMLAPEAIRQDLDFLLSQAVLPLAVDGSGPAIEDAEQRINDYVVDECGIAREEVEAPDDGLFD